MEIGKDGFIEEIGGEQMTGQSMGCVCVCGHRKNRWHIYGEGKCTKEGCKCLKYTPRPITRCKAHTPIINDYNDCQRRAGHKGNHKFKTEWT